MATQSFSKDPGSTLDYNIDWSAWLPTGDTISASAWTVPTGLTEESDAFTTTETSVWLSGGTAGTTYTVTNQITTALGRIEQRSIYIVVRER